MVSEEVQDTIVGISLIVGIFLVASSILCIASVFFWGSSFGEVPAKFVLENIFYLIIAFIIILEIVFGMLCFQFERNKGANSLIEYALVNKFVSVLITLLLFFVLIPIIYITKLYWFHILVYLGLGLGIAFWIFFYFRLNYLIAKAIETFKERDSPKPIQKKVKRKVGRPKKRKVGRPRKKK